MLVYTTHLFLFPSFETSIIGKGIAGALANKLGLTWETKEGVKKANYWGSLMLASTVKLGNDARGNSVYTPLSNMLPST